MKRFLLLVALTLPVWGLQSRVYSFPSGSVTCVASIYGKVSYVQSCSSLFSVVNADGTYLAFDIKNGFLSYTQFEGGKVKDFSGPLPVSIEFSSGGNLTLSTNETLGAFTFRPTRCSGGTRGAPAECSYSSVGSPSGTLTLTSPSPR